MFYTIKNYGDSKMGSETREKIEKLVDAKFLALCVIISIFSAVFFIALIIFMNPGKYNKWFDPACGWMPFATAPAMYAIGVLLFTLIQRKIKVDPRKFALIYAMVMTSSLYASSAGWPIVTMYLASSSRDQQAISNWGEPGVFTLPLWAWPERSVLEELEIGGASVPWNVWTMPYLTFAFGYLIHFLLSLSLMSLLRGAFVDVERLEFPHMIIASRVIEISTRPRELPRSRLSILAVGAVLVFLFYSTIPIAVLVAPWWPNPLAMWEKPPFQSWHEGLLDWGYLIPTLLETLPGHSFLMMTQPLIWLFVAFVPTSILFSAFLFNEVYNAIAMYYTFTGYVPKPTIPGWSMMSTWIFLHKGLWYEPFVYIGMTFGLVIFPLIIGGNWEHMKSTFRSLLKGPTSEEKENEAMPHRLSYLLLIVSFILWVIWLSTVYRIIPYISVITAIFWVFYIIWAAKIRAGAGWTGPLMHDYYAPLPADLHEMIPEYRALPPTTAERVALTGPQAAAFRSWAGQWHFNRTFDFGFAGGTSWGTPSYIMESFKLGQMFKVRPKDILKVLTLGTIIVLFLSFPTALGIVYFTGLKAPGFQWAWSMRYFAYGDPGPGFMNTPAYENPALHIGVPSILGFLLMGALVFLRAHFIWWPIHPIGAMLGMVSLMPNNGMGLIYGVLWIVKTIILKVGGLKSSGKNALSHSY